MAVRQRVLRNLTALAALPARTVYPHAPTVLRVLAACLDDRKRLVRQAAVACRNAWFLLREP
jgi:DNA repair/transcription protein MET18/MMS19